MFQLSLSHNQLSSVSLALETFERLSCGDLCKLERLMENETIVAYSAAKDPRKPVDPETRSLSVLPILNRMRTILGYPRGDSLQPSQLISRTAMSAVQVLLALRNPGPHRDGKPDFNEPKGHLVVPLLGAYALNEALEVFTRLCLGQFGIVTEMVISDVICKYAEPGSQATRLPISDAWDQFDPLATGLKLALGFPANGSFGIGHPHVHASAHNAWEVKKVLAKALALDRDSTEPSPAVMRGVDYDGLIVRYTSEPEPVAIRLS